MMKNMLLCLITIFTLFLGGCGQGADVSGGSGFDANYSEENNDISETTTSNFHDNKALTANQNNITDDGFIIINDPEDYPEFVKKVRYCEKTADDVYSVTDFYGNEVFELKTVACPIFVDDLSPFSEDGVNFGYVDIEGNIVIEAKYSQAGYFCNGTARVEDGSEEYYIDVNGQQTENSKLHGYKGSIDDFIYCNAFTGDYLMYCRDNGGDRIYGYADKDGTMYDMNECNEISSFNSGYALVSNKSGALYFIDADFNRVTRDIRNDLYYDIDFRENDWCGAHYIFENGYIIATICNEFTDYVPQRKLLKICPELYGS